MKKNGIAAVIFLSAFIVVLLNVVVWVLGSVVVGLISTAVSLFVYAIFLSAVDRVNKNTPCDCVEEVSETEIVTDDNDTCGTENNIESKDNAKNNEILIPNTQKKNSSLSAKNSSVSSERSQPKDLASVSGFEITPSEKTSS